MKKIMILALAVILAACSSAPAAVATEPPAPTEVLPTQTPIVVVQTVIVESTPVPTEVPPTEVPPTAAPVVVTVVVQATNPPADTSANPTASSSDPNAPITIDAALGRGVFSAMTMSSDKLTLRCSPRDITFNVTTPNLDIADVAFYYRIVDLRRLYPSEWKLFGKMQANGGGNFTLTFSGENVDSNIRLDGSYLDFQFVGLARSGNVVDRSERITDLVTYTFDCP